MSVNGFGGTRPGRGTLAQIMSACQRLNPCFELDVDVLAVQRIALASSYADWNAGTLTNVTVDLNTGLVRLSESTPSALFSNTATGLPTAEHTFVDGNGSPGVEEYAFDFFPDASATGGVPFTLDSLGIFIGRIPTSGIYAFAQDGNIRVNVSYYDANWRLVPLGDPIDIKPTAIPTSKGNYVIKFRQDWSRRFIFDPGIVDTRTGTGFDGTTARASVNPDSKGISHIPVARGLSISILLSGRNFQYAVLGCYPNGAAAGQLPQFDPTQFWRYAPNRACGPYSPDNQPYSGSDAAHNPDDFLVSGAVPGYGAVASLSGNGKWGIARRIINAQRAQSTQAWLQPYHSLNVVTYLATGSVVATLDMGGTPTNPVEIRIDDFQPRGTSMAYTMRRSPDNSTWTSIGTVTDGQVLTGADLTRYYELTATFTPGPSTATKYVSPALQAWSMVERITLSTYRYLRDVDSTCVADPVTAQSSIGELKLPVVKAGRPDYRDLGSRLGTDYAPSYLEAHVYGRNTVSGVRMFLNSYRLEDRNPLYGVEEMTFVSGMDRLTATIPPPSETYRWPLSGQGTISAIALVSGLTYRVTPTGTPGYTTGKLVGMRMHGVTLASAGLDYTITANTATTFDITCSDAPNNLPAVNDTFEIHSDVTQRVGAVYIGADFADVYKDILAVQAGVPARYRGLLPATTGRLTTNTLPPAGSKALSVLQDVALHCGGFPAWDKGRISFVDFYGKKDTVATWDDRHIVSLTTPLGADRRMPAVTAKYGYSADSRQFTNEITINDLDTLIGWGRPNLFDTYQISDNVCQWNDLAEAKYLAGTLLQQAWKSGVRLWTVKTALMWPWLSQGDAVAIVTDQYTDRRLHFAPDGLTDTGWPVAGRISATAVIVGKNLWGTEFLVGIRGLDAINQIVTSSGPAGVDPAPGSLIGGLNNFRTLSETSDERTIGWTRGTAVDSVWYATMEFDSPLPADPWAQVKALSQPLLPAGTDTLVVKRPKGRRVLLIQCEPRDANLNITGDVRRMTLEGAPPQPPVITTTPGENGSTGTLFARVQARGETVVSVQVQVKVGPSDPSAWQNPSRTTGAVSYVNGGVLGISEYEHDVLRDDTRIARIQYRAVLGDGSVLTTDPTYFDRNDRPNIILADGDGSKVTIIGDADTKSIRIKRTDGSYEYWADGPALKVDLSVVAGNGQTGSQATIATGERWPLSITAYGLPRLDPKVTSSPQDTASIVVNGATAVAVAVWQYGQVAAPIPLGTKDVTIALQSSLSATYTTVVTERHDDGTGFTQPVNITGALSPALSAPPTALTSYTWSGLSASYNLTLNQNGARPIEVEITAQILNAGGAIVATIIRSALWYYGAVAGTVITPPTSPPTPPTPIPGIPFPANTWAVATLAEPSAIGSKFIRLTLQAAFATGTVKLLFRRDDSYGWSAQSDITASVSPAISTPPTASTVYTYSVPDRGFTSYAKQASGTPIVAEVEAQLYDDGLVLISTVKATASWFYTDTRI